jgi:beta-lactamase regulating signal transducer with metallopeptidase domain
MFAVNHSILLGALGWSLINSLWQMALLWALYALITARGNRFSAAARHGLALLLTSLGSLWFLITLISLYHTGGWQVGLVKQNLMESPWSSLAGSLYSVQLWAKGLSPFLSMAYLTWLTYLSIRYLNWYLRLRHLKSGGLQQVRPQLLSYVEHTAMKLGIRKKVELFLSRCVDSPMTIGFFKPIILVPIAALNNLTTEQVESILLHELTHIRRSDYLVNLLLTGVSIVFFFNPFCQLLICEMKRDRELSCDDQVIQFPYCPRIYAGALLVLERTRQRNHELAMAATGRSNRLLLERIQRVTGSPKVKKSRFGVWPAYLTAIPATLMLTGYLILGQPLQRASTLTGGERTVTAIRSSHARWVARNPGLPGSKGSVIEYPGQQIQANADRPIVGPVGGIARNPVLADQADDLVDASTNQDPALDPEILPPVAATPASRTLAMDFSIAPQAAAPAAPKIEPGFGDFPYVASSSFSIAPADDPTYLDSARTTQFSEDWMTKKLVDKDLREINTVDRMLIDKKISDDTQQMNLEEWQMTMQKSLREVNWERVDQDLKLAISGNDLGRINQDMALQLRAVQSLQHSLQQHSRDASRGNQSVRRNSSEQLQLHLIKKRLESVHQAMDLIRKKTPIVYI